MAQILQYLSYKVNSTTSPIFFAFGLPIPVLGIHAIIHQQLVAMLRGHVRFAYTSKTDTTINLTMPILWDKN